MTALRAGLVTLVALAGFAPPARADVVESLVTGGPIANRLNVAILGDGYTSSTADQAKLASDARAVLTGLLAFGPYQRYRGLFNVKLIHTISASNTVPKNGAGGATALGCYFGCGGIDRLVCCGAGSEGSVATVTAANVPEATLSIVVVNDATYGGSGGGYAVVSTHSAAVDILRHELGHTLGDLADEYSDPYPAYPACDPATDCLEPNATLIAHRPGKWDQWVAPEVCAPTQSDAAGVGYFEGCRYQATGVYRPISNPLCLMYTLEQPFCPVCAEAVALALWSHARQVDATAPPTTAPVQTTGCVTQTFALAVPSNAGQLAIAWSIDGAAQADTTATATFDANRVAPGDHQVVAKVRDVNPEIRADPHRLTSTTTAWTWQTSCATGVAPDAGPIAPADAAVPDAPYSCQLGQADGGDAASAASGGCCGAAGADGLGGSVIAAMIALSPVVRRRRCRCAA